MTKLLYLIWDSKSESYSIPFIHLARGDALREFTRAANSNDSKIGLNPEDFSLFEVGQFDERTGEFVIYEVKEHVANAHELVTTESEKPQAA